MSDYYWKQIVVMLLDKIEKMTAHEEETNQYIDELQQENVRLNQRLGDK